MCENNIPTLGYLNNCDELRDFMMYHFDDPLNGTACFQGDMVEFDGYAVPKEGEIIPMDGYGVNFTVGLKTNKQEIVYCVDHTGTGYIYNGFVAFTKEQYYESFRKEIEELIPEDLRNYLWK